MLTPEQIITLRTLALASPEALNYITTGNDNGLAEWFNTPTTFVVWRTSVNQDEIMQNGFNWVQVDNLTVGKARIWEWLFDNQSTSINPSKINVRAGIDEAWKGTAAMLAVRDAVYVHCKRFATIAEKALAVGLGTENSPGTLTFEGLFTANSEISEIARG